MNDQLGYRALRIGTRSLNKEAAPSPAPKFQSARMPSISFVVARSYPGNVIGNKNALPWHIRSDLKRFRKITSSHVVIMGRNTYESIGKPLPNRTNVVVTRSAHLANTAGFDFYSDTQLIFTNTREDTLFFADVISICHEYKDIFVIGGQGMYELFGDLVNKVYLTEVTADVSGDAFFPMKFPAKAWKTLEETYVGRSEHDEFPHKFTIYQRRDRKSRSKFVGQFMTEIEQKKAWIKNNIEEVKRKVSNYVSEAIELDF
jgi:dihydrofolate reductase